MAKRKASPNLPDPEVIGSAMPEINTSQMVPLWILEDEVDLRLLPRAGVARLEGRPSISIDELMSDLLSNLRSSSPARDAMKAYLSSGELSLADFCIRMISDPQQREAAVEDHRKTETALLREYQANLASINSEIDALRAKGLPGYELLRSQPFLDNAERHAADRRLGKGLESLQQCFDFVINVDDMMDRWAAEFEQLWDQAQKVFSAMPYSPTVDSIEHAAAIFRQCRQWHDTHHKNPTQACIDELRKLLKQLQEISTGEFSPISHPSTTSPAVKQEKTDPPGGSFFRPRQETHSGKAQTPSPPRLSSTSFKLEAMLESIDCSSEEETARSRASFIKQLSVVVGVSNNEEGLRPILGSVSSERQRRTLAAWLLRFLCRCSPTVENDRDFRVRVCELFDTHLGPLYKALELHAGQPNHEKLAKLRDSESELLAKFDAITRTIVSVQTAIAIQNRFMQELRRPANQIFLEEFVDSSLQSDERLRELFNAVKDYAESPASACVEAYHKLDEAFTSFFKDETQVSTSTSRQCLVAPLMAIHNVVREHFQHNDVVKPAQVYISDTNRKYPLHIKGRWLDLKLLLSNDGPGHAFDVEVEIDPPPELEVSRPVLNLGTLPMGNSIIIFEAKVIGEPGRQNPCVVLRASWNNFGQRRSVHESIFEIVGQPAGIDWDQLRTRQPYSLEAVETEDQLVGRGDVIKSLLNRLQAERIESSILFGQRRVGKTSIAKILLSKLQQMQNHVCIYTEIGALNTLTSEKFVNSLGSTLHDELSMHLGLENSSVAFEGSLAPLTSFMKTLHRTRPELRFVFIFDEFDEVPSELFRYTPIANTFF